MSLLLNILFPPRALRASVQTLFWIYSISLISGEVLLLPAIAQTSAVPARIDAAAYQRVVEENLDLRKEQASMDGEMGVLRRKNASLLLDIQDLERKRDQLTALVAQLKTPDELAAQMARLNSEKVVLVREIERLRESLAASIPPATNLVPVVVTPAPGSDLFRKLERENADLRQDIAKARATGMNESVAKEIVQKNEIVLTAEVSRLKAENKVIAAEIESYRRREAGLKKAVELQAKKAFDADKASKEARELQIQKNTAAEAALNKLMEQRRPARPLALQNDGGAPASATNGSFQQAASNSSSVPDLLAEGKKNLLAGQVKEAEKLYLEAFKGDPGNAAISYNLGVVYGDYLKDYSKAVKYYRNYLDLAPKAADADVVRSWLIDLSAKAKW